MTVHKRIDPTSAAEQLLEDLAEELTITPERAQAAERSYRSLGRWLDRPNSSLAGANVEVYAQGSFRLGTVIKPASDKDDYDLDVVCEVAWTKQRQSQKALKELIGAEVASYAQSQNMQPPSEGRRCWTLDYADGAQFHMDVLPALPDGGRQRLLLEAAHLDFTWSHDALAVTDRLHMRYPIVCDDWPSSNPKAYASWFIGRTGPFYRANRQATAFLEHANVEDIPEHRVRTPLQDAVKILKRHRDVSFTGQPDDRPISIIITTLAALSYQQEATISGALFSILATMDSHIEQRDGVDWIPNPTDPRENFADKWQQYPQRRAAFYEWLEVARSDFNSAAQQSDPQALIDALAPRMGRTLVEAAVARAKRVTRREERNPIRAAIRKLFDAPHRKPVTWPILASGEVSIVRATVTRNGYRTTEFASDSAPLPKRASLTFEARTTVSGNYRVYWQVVNTGPEAEGRRNLRGGFEETVVERGNLTKEESTLFTGTHSIECFIVKDGYCVARSGPFIVNID